MNRGKRNLYWRVFGAITLFLCCFSTILYIFWKQEVKFTLPTPKPENLNQLAAGQPIALDIIQDTSKITFIHYYNYDCPCSRFNIKEFKQMYYQYRDAINFIVVVQAADQEKDAKKLFMEKYDLEIRTIHDRNGAIANQLGIYSTPQAIIIKNNTLYYRGNYNRARFCTSRNTKFAEMALASAVQNKSAPWMPMQATLAYGCELPSNEQNSKSELFNFLR